MEIRPTRPDEWARLRVIRLAALAESPTAFLSTLAEAEKHPDDTWKQRATPSEDQASFAAVDDDSWLGMCAVRRHEPAAQLVAMWVDPARRHRGVGAALVAATLEWCRVRGIATMFLWVNEANAPALALYRRAGFEPTGERQRLDSHPGQFEIAMSRPVAESR